MATTKNVPSLVRLLGAASNPSAAFQYRNVAVTRHGVVGSLRWAWQQQGVDSNEVACLVFLHGEARFISGDPDGPPVGRDVFLHPHREGTIAADGQGAAYCLWVPWNTLSEIENDVRRPGLSLSPTPLLNGLRAFTASLFTQRSALSTHTEFMLERILAEMAFGVLVESVANPLAASEWVVSPIDRARALMMIRRADPAFGMTELAQELHISTRQLQRLFAAEGSTPNRELRQLRVSLAVDLLKDRSCAPLSVNDIAHHSGFGSASALRRAFSEEGLPSPRRAREENAKG